MIIKELLRKAAEKLTGRKCCRCRYNVAGRCCHPDGKMFMRCWHSVTRPGFTGKYEDKPLPEHIAINIELSKRIKEGFEAGVQAACEKNRKNDNLLTQEEEYQLQRIREVLQQAEDDARESGLLVED